MKYTQNRRDDVFFSIIACISVLSGVCSFVSSTQIFQVSEPALHGAAPADEVVREDVLTLQARRLQQRLSRTKKPVPGIAILEHALREREHFEKQTIHIKVQSTSQSDSPLVEWNIDFSKHPELLTLQTTWSTPSFGIDDDLFSNYMSKGIFGDIVQQQSIVLSHTVQDGKVLRAAETPIARSGYIYEIPHLTNSIEKALQNNTTDVSVDAEYVDGSVSTTIDGKLRKLDLLATGLSDFSHSTDDRVWNVHKAVDERVNNIVIEKGQTFSFVDALGGPVTLQKGWREGLGLFGGGAAVTPGAGICQAATTVYRAALLSGLPITYKRNHSMFVDHYEPYGVGLDATIFPGVHDMTFKNDTSDLILIQSYTVGDKVYVHFYGIDDGRSVALDGPYFNTTTHRAKELRALDFDEIGWVRTVTFSDGTKKVKPIVSTYHKGFPKRVKQKYAGTPGITLLRIPGTPTDRTVASLLP